MNLALLEPREPQELKHWNLWASLWSIQTWLGREILSFLTKQTKSKTNHFSWWDFHSILQTQETHKISLHSKDTLRAGWSLDLSWQLAGMQHAWWINTLGQPDSVWKNNLNIWGVFCNPIVHLKKGISDNKKHVGLPRSLPRKSPNFLVLSRTEKSQGFLLDFFFFLLLVLDLSGKFRSTQIPS